MLTIQSASAPLKIGTPVRNATAGSILFAGVAGILQQDNAGLVYDDTLNSLGIGVAPSTGLRLHAQYINTTTAQMVAMYVNAVVNPSGATSNNQRAAQFSLVYAGTNQVTSGQGFFVDGQISNTNGANDMRGFSAGVTLTGGGQAASVAGATVAMSHQSTGTVGQYIGLYVLPLAMGASATLTSCYGIYIDDLTPTNGTRTNLPYGIYQIDVTIRNFFGAKVAIGIDSQAAQLVVTPGAVGTIGQILKAMASQTGDLLQLQDSGAGILGAFKAAGGFLSRGFHASKTANYPVVVADSGTEFDNIGAAGTVIFTLPTAVVGLRYGFCVKAAQILRVTAAASTTISIGTTTSAAAGSIEASVAYAYVEIEAISTTEWVAKTSTGTWTVT